MQEATTHIERRQTQSRPGRSANWLLIQVRSARPMVGPGRDRLVNRVNIHRRAAHHAKVAVELGLALIAKLGSRRDLRAPRWLWG